jgi:hypothetical protein
MRRRQPARRSGNAGPERPWRLPAALSTLALFALAAWPFLDRFAPGTATRQTLVFVLAVGCCAGFLGLGLGLWIAVRVRTVASVAAAAWSLLVAVAWWGVVFGPLLRPSSDG